MLQKKKTNCEKPPPQEPDIKEIQPRKGFGKGTQSCLFSPPPPFRLTTGIFKRPGEEKHYESTRHLPCVPFLFSFRSNISCQSTFPAAWSHLLELQGQTTLLIPAQVVQNEHILFLHLGDRCHNCKQTSLKVLTLCLLSVVYTLQIFSLFPK